MTHVSAALAAGAAAVLAAAVTDGCSAPAPAAPRWNGPLVTDASAYLARPVPREPGRFGFTVVAQFTNHAPTPVRLEWCGGGPRVPSYAVLLTRPDSARDVAAYNVGWGGCVDPSEKIVVAPGATRVDTFALSGPNAWSAREPRGRGTLEGEFRLAYLVDGGGAHGPLDSAFWSNLFTVRLGR